MMDIFIWITVVLVALVFWLTGIIYCFHNRKWLALFFCVLIKPVAYWYACQWVYEEFTRERA